MNLLGVRTLFVKELRRFLRVPGQTLLSPLITTSLYFLVFGWSLGARIQEVDGVPYARFILPGLVMLGVVTNAYLNSASSLFVMKLQGTVVDLLVSPLSYAEILGAFVAAAVARGLLVGGIMWLVGALFTGFGVAHPGARAAAPRRGRRGLRRARVPHGHLGGQLRAGELPPHLRGHAAHLPGGGLLLGVHGAAGAALAHPGEPPLLPRRGAALVGDGEGRCVRRRRGSPSPVILAAGALLAAYGVLRSGWRLRG